MKKIKDKVKALELLQQRDSNPKITCQWIADQCGYSRKQIERLSAERKEKDTSAILTHGNTGRKPATTASDQEIRYLEKLKKTYPSITITQFRNIYLEDVIRNKDMEADVVKYGLKERIRSWFRELFVREGWKSPADKLIRMDGSRITHSTRPPRAHMGELVQIDGTPYDWFNRKYRLYLNMKFSYPVKDSNDLFRPIPTDFNYSRIFRAEYPRQIRNNVFSMGNSLYTAVTSDGEVVRFNQKQSITVYEDAITEEIYIERYGKHYTCMKVEERKRDRIYSVNNEKELQKVLNEMAEEKAK